jgi:hypothetical protein
MKKLSAIILVIVGLGMMLAGCDSAGGALGPISNETIVGKWYMRTFSEHGSTSYHLTTPKDTTIVTTVSKDTTYTGTAYYVEIKADGTISSVSPTPLGKVSAVEYTTNGTWKHSGSTLTTIFAVGSAYDTSTTEVGITDGTLKGSSRIQKTTTSGTATFIYDVTTTTTYSK